MSTPFTHYRGRAETKTESVMTDIILESVRAFVLLGIVIFLWNTGRDRFELSKKGWNFIVAGFGLLLMGSLIDITDNFEELNRFYIIGDTPTEAFLEKFVGFLGGFIMLAVGLMQWIPDQSTEHERSKKALQESQDLFSKAFHLCPVAQSFSNPSDGTYHDVNDTWIKAFGYSHAEAMANSSLKLGFWVNPNDRSAFLDMLKNNDLPTNGFETKIRAKSGNEHNILAYGEFVEINSEVMLFMIFHDITERKKTEQELRESQELFSKSFRASPVALAISYPHDGTHVDVNETWCAMLGYSHEEAMAHSAVDLGIWADPESRIRFVEKLKTKKSARAFETKMRAKDGHEVDVLISGEYLEIGGEPRLLVVCHDITERKKTERELRESQELFSKSFQANPVPLSISSPKGAIIDLNEAWLTTMGYTREEAIGKSSLKLGIWADPKERAQFVELLQEKGIVNGYETQYRTKSGELRDMVVSGEWVEVHGEHRLFNLSLDVTDNKAAKRELTDHRDHLQELVYTATQELNAKADELEEALAKEKEIHKLQREFVSMASHEFRTPLAIIDATAQRMKSQADKNQLTPDDAVKRVEKIRNAVQRMTRLMESTLDAARMEEGKIRIEIEPCDIGNVVREVCARQQEISQTHVISCNLAGLPEIIQADTGSLEQALANLLSNAVKYAPEAPDIEVKAHTEGDQVVISVRDHGIGIDENELDRIGERFFRAKTSTGTAGTGIGLNLARTLVEMHDGTLSVESKKGEGSTFTIGLPIAGPDQSEQVDSRVA